jgi:hypothetical protein
MSGQPDIPVGQLEGQRLEFKSAAALLQPASIVREVVGMLNSEGGEVWIGLRDEGGRAIAVDLIPAVERERGRLLDSLVDSLSPRPGHQEVTVEAVSFPESGDGGLLRIHVVPKQQRRPYAQVKGASFTFVVRVGSRLRPMEREEILGEGGTGEEKLLHSERARISREADAVRGSGESGLWLRVQPVPKLDIDPADGIFSELASDPHRSGNRRFRSFAISRKLPTVRLDHVEWGMEKSLAVRFDADGGATFMLALDLVSMRTESDDPMELDPLRLAEYSVSGLRIARSVYDHFGLPLDAQVLVELALLGRGNFLLRPGSPGPFFSHGEPADLQEADAAAGLSFSADEFLDNPDHCGFRLLSLIYQAFGIREEDMPQEFDRQTGRLILRE